MVTNKGHGLFEQGRDQWPNVSSEGTEGSSSQFIG